MCILLCIHVGQRDQQLEAVYIEASSSLKLPDVGAWVIVAVSAVVSATSFYAQLPLGDESRLSAKKAINTGTTSHHHISTCILLCLSTQSADVFPCLHAWDMDLSM